jgi:hypothetical protein
MKRMAFIPLLCAFTILCMSTYAADEPDQPKLTVSLDHGKLTEWVLEDFPKGLPFDRTGMPTDLDAATKFWRLVADWPIQVVGEVTDVRATLEQISDETGLPILYGENALAKIEATEKKMRMVTISDSVEKAVKIIAMQAGVEQTGVTPLGLVLLGPEEDPDSATLLTAPPKNTFRWRANYSKLVEKTFGEDWNPLTGSEDDFKKLMEIASGVRCDLAVVKPVELDAFVQWLSAVSGQTIQNDRAAVRPDEAVPIMLRPMTARFAPFLDALNMALQGTGFEATAGETHFVIARAEPKNTFRWQEDYWKKVRKELGADWDWMKAPDEERERFMEIIAETRCDLIVVEEMELREFVDWYARASEQNIIIEPAAFQLNPDPRQLEGEFPADGGGESEDSGTPSPTDEESGFEEEGSPPDFGPPAGGDVVPEPRKVARVVLRFTKNAEALTAALAAFDLKAVPGGNGGLLIVPKDCTEEELEEMRQFELESVRSMEDSSD